MSTGQLSNSHFNAAAQKEDKNSESCIYKNCFRVSPINIDKCVQV